MRVLIAYDGSGYADAALHDLPRAGLHDVDALVLSVEEVWLPPQDMLPESMTAEARRMLVEHHEAATAASRRVADRAAAWLREQVPHWRVAAEGAAGSPLEAIVSRAESWRADLVVVGAHGRSAAPFTWPGSVTSGVLRHVQPSVRVARQPSERPGSPTRLILGIDGSAHAEGLVEHVRSRSWPARTQVRVVTVVDTRLTRLVVPGVSVGPTSPEWAHEVADRAAAALRDGGLDTAAWVEWGDPKRVLLDAARAWPADCVYVAARGLSRLAPRHLGRVSMAVALHAPCTVEVFRAPADGSVSSIA